MAKEEESKTVPEEIHVNVFEARTVELKSGHKYLLLLRGSNIDAYHIQSLSDELRRLGFESLVVSMEPDVEAVVIEQPPVEVPVTKDVAPKKAEGK